MLCSVLIPAYNVERYIGAAVESALSQTVSDIEVIVVNDGSTDATKKAIEPFLDRIVYIEQDNRGLSGARNAGLRAASGEFVALLDADDMWLPHKLEKMLGYIREHPEISLLTSDSYLMLEDERTSSTFYGRFKRNRRFRWKDQAYWITQYNFIHIMVLIRRSLFEAHGMFDERLRAAEDWEMWFRALVGGEQAGLIDEPLGYYRVREGSLSYGARKAFADQLEMFNLLSEKYATSPPRGLEGRRLVALAKKRLVEGEAKGAGEAFRAAASDPGLPISTRAVAATLGTMPKVAGKLFERRYPANP